MNRNIPIMTVLLASLVLHGAILLWPIQQTTVKTSASTSQAGIQISLRTHTAVTNKAPGNTKPPENRPQLQTQSANSQTSKVQTKSVKPAASVRNNNTERPVKAPRLAVTEKTSDIDSLATIQEKSTAVQASSSHLDSQQLQVRIQQLIKFRVSHNQHYPRLARKRAWEGQVKLGMQVQSDGQLTGVHVIASSGHRVLDKAAMKSVRVVTHLPEARVWLQGRSIDVILPVIYKLTDS